MQANQLKSFIAEFPDFPQKGVNFKDISPLLANPQQFSLAINEMCQAVENIEFNKIVAIEARGFIFAAAIAYKLQKGLIICRKPGKLPGELIAKGYNYEYSSSEISIQKDKLTKDDTVLVVDDVLATGNTALAAYQLSASCARVAGYLFFIELDFLKGREKLKENSPVTDQQIYSILHY
ncbi:MAG TPA: adenine phosphoribosyltransferase [Patescibacteria group bacterium]|nr:adenine phosphoribosyltransferase [Patescibacteria group bacterium]